MDPFEERYAERCALCERTDQDDQWLWLTVARPDEEHDGCDLEEVELVFCTQEHASRYLAERTLEWPPHDHDSQASGVRVDVFFLGCGLLAIVLSIVGLVAVVRWIF